MVLDTDFAAAVSVVLPAPKAAADGSGGGPSYQTKREKGEGSHGGTGKAVYRERVHHLHHYADRRQRPGDHQGGGRGRHDDRGRPGAAPGGESGVCDQNPGVPPGQEGKEEVRHPGLGLV